MKQCKDCKQEFPATPEYFTRNKNKPDGLDIYCKPCKKRRNKKWVNDNPDKVRAGKISWRKRNPEKSREYTKRVRSKNPEKSRELAKEWVYKNRVSTRRSSLAWRKRNPDRVKQKDGEYRKNNPDKMKIYRARRKARKQLFADTLTNTQWLFALGYFNTSCAVCGCRDMPIAADHWIPLNSPECPGTIPTNIVPLCHGKGGCNNSKADTPAEDWLVCKFGQDKAIEILERIQQYFDSLSDSSTN